MIVANRALFAALLAVVSMSWVPVLIRSTSANEFTIGLVRLMIAVAVVSPLLFFKQRPQLQPRQWLGLLLVGIVFGAHWLLYFISIKSSSAAIGAIAVSTYGIHLLLLQWFIKKQPIRPLEWLAVLLCFVGCLLVAPNFTLSDQVTLGLLVGVVSGFLYACLPLLHQRLLSVPTFTRAWGQFTFALLFFLPTIPWSNWQLAAGDWWSLAVLGVVCTVIGHSLWVKSSSELPAIVTSLIYYLYVPIAMVTSFLFLDETITLGMIAGAACIIVANVFTAVLSWRRVNRVTRIPELAK